MRDASTYPARFHNILLREGSGGSLCHTERQEEAVIMAKDFRRFVLAVRKQKTMPIYDIIREKVIRAKIVVNKGGWYSVEVQIKPLLKFNIL